MIKMSTQSSFKSVKYWILLSTSGLFCNNIYDTPITTVVSIITARRDIRWVYCIRFVCDHTRILSTRPRHGHVLRVLPDK